MGRSIPSWLIFREECRGDNMEKIDISKICYNILAPVFSVLLATAIAHIAYNELKAVMKEVKKED